MFSTITATLYQIYSGQAFIQSSQQTEQIEKDNLKTEITPSPVPVTVLYINKDSQHLRLLLSADSVTLLSELINTMNELHHYLPYLQQEHPYLAHSVAKEHEPQIIELFYHHIEEIKALNESILEKQMAGFSQTGTEAERTFRNKIMELKILLKWYIAQHPDELSVSNHQVILNRLQNTTLKKMMSAFYDASSTDEQRQQLQQQLDELLEHFKSQSPISNNSSKHTNNSSDDLLKLNHAPNTPIDLTALVINMGSWFG